MKFPFDVQVNSQNPEYDFAKELDIVGEEAGVKDSCVYRIYENHTNAMNTWLYTHLRYFGDEYRREDGTPDEKKIRKGSDDDAYCRYDTYMGLSDYNHLRKMLGYSTETLGKNEYILQMKQRVYKETGDFTDDVKLQDRGETLTCRKICTESFSQDGHNGGDYIIVVPDERIQQMTPYYSELAVSVKKKVPDNLQNKLDDLSDKHDYAGHTYMEEDDDNVCYGTDTIVTYAAVNLVRENASAEVRYMMSCITFPCMYIGLVFLCIALTVLSVQQLSDSAKYRFRYQVLSKIGLGRREIQQTVFRQLSGYYLCPAILSAVISGIIAVYMGAGFNFYTGVSTPVLQYFAISFALFFGVYVVYFGATYVGFIRNIEE